MGEQIVKEWDARVVDVTATGVAVIRVRHRGRHAGLLRVAADETDTVLAHFGATHDWRADLKSSLGPAAASTPPATGGRTAPSSSDKYEDVSEADGQLVRRLAEGDDVRDAMDAERAS